ncbi:MAG: hypothetical protein NT009_13790 [Proteobacteria bacterium]|nr:hypothetical protein [Pseudomonadota bacterium]
MKLRLQKMVCSLLLVLPLSLLLTCAQQTDPAKMKIQELLAEGKTYLGNSNFDGAVQSFQLILNEYDPENLDALYGVAISLTLKQLAGMSDQFQSIFDTLFKMIGGITSDPPRKFTPQATSGVNAIVESVVDDAVLDALDAVFPYWDKLKQHPEFSMTLDSVPLTIGVEPYLVYKSDMGGVADLGTVYFVSAIMRFFKSLIYIMYAVNLDLTPSLPGLIQQFLPILQGQQSLTVDRDFILGLLAYIVDSSPKFLTLEPSEGKNRLSEAADLMAGSIQDLLSCLDFISAEKSSQLNHIVAYKFENNKQCMIFNIKQDGKPMVIEFEFADQVRASFQNLISSFQSSGGVQASWSQDMAPYLGLLLQGLLQAGLLDPVLAFALPMLQPYLGADTVAMVNQLMGTVKTMAQGGLLAGGMTTIIPDVIQFDFGKFMHDPPARFIRLILPAVVKVKDDNGNIIYDQKGDPILKLLLEYECTDLADNSLWCPYPETITSSAHFIGTDYQIADDGIKNPLPYISSQDPSLGGLLYLNLNSLDPSLDNSFHQPTSYEFNYFLGKVIGGLLGGLGNLTSSPGTPAMIRRPSGS